MKSLASKKTITVFTIILLAFKAYSQSYLHYDSTYDFHGAGTGAGIYAMDLEPDGSIIAGGYFSSFNGNNNYDFLVKLNYNGIPDNSYEANIGVVGDLVTSLRKQPDGKLLVGGYFSSFNSAFCNRIIRLNADGTKDNTFKVDSLLHNPVSPYAGYIGWLNDIELSGTNIFIAGSFSFLKYGVYYFQGISMLNSTGKLDTINFNVGKGVPGNVYDIEIQPDGKILIGGDFTQCNGVIKNSILRLNTDGTLDNTFSSGTGVASLEGIYKIKVLPDGKILIGGDFTSYNGTTVKAFARLNSNGTIDNTFNTGTGFTYASSSYTIIREIKLLSNNKIMASGEFDFYNGSPTASIAQLNYDGTIDPTFKNTTTASGIFRFEFQETDKIIAAGTLGHFYFDQNNVGNYINGLVRFDIRPYTTAITSASNTKSILVYPSPSNGSFEISVREGELIKEISVTNAIGQKEILENSIQVETTLKGLLYLSVKTDQTTYLGKIVIE